MPKVDRWARLTVRLPADTYHRLEALAEEIPGMTPNGLIRLAVEQLTPQLEAMAHALKTARAGQESTALDLLVALTQVARNQPLPPADEPGLAQRGDPQAVLAQMHALQQAQDQRVQDVLGQPQGRALRQGLERLQDLQQEQVQRVQAAMTQPPAGFSRALEWLMALQEEQVRWLEDLLAQPRGRPLRQALERIHALQEEQGRVLQEALGQVQARQQELAPVAPGEDAVAARPEVQHAP